MSSPADYISERRAGTNTMSENSMPVDFCSCYFPMKQALINSCATKPVVKLLINRHNNKYSYTGASDDNLLKNIELFDKLSLRFRY